MKKNGFTLVELLAMLVVLGIIMVIAIPNITGMIQNQKLDLLKSDATNMVESARMRASKEKIVKPKKNECIVFSLNYLDNNDNILKGPNGGNYDRFDSLVVYTRKGNEYVYYVRLVEEYKGKRIGIHLVQSPNINALKTRDINEVNDDTELVKTDRDETAINKLNIFAPIMGNCTTIKSYYSGGNYCVVKNGVYYDINGNIVTQSNYNKTCS